MGRWVVSKGDRLFGIPVALDPAMPLDAITLERVWLPPRERQPLEGPDPWEEAPMPDSPNTRKATRTILTVLGKLSEAEACDVLKALIALYPHARD